MAEIVEDDLAAGGGDFGPAADVAFHLRPEDLVVTVGVDSFEQPTLETGVIFELIAVEVAVLVDVEAVELLPGVGESSGKRVEDRTASASSVLSKEKLAKSGLVVPDFTEAKTRTCGNWPGGGSSSRAASTSGGCSRKAANSSWLSSPSPSVSNARKRSGDNPDSSRDSFPSPLRSYRRMRRAANNGPAPSSSRLLTAARGRGRVSVRGGRDYHVVVDRLELVQRYAVVLVLVLGQQQRRRLKDFVFRQDAVMIRVEGLEDEVIGLTTGVVLAKDQGFTGDPLEGLRELAGRHRFRGLPGDSERAPGPRRVVFRGERSNSARLSLPSLSMSRVRKSWAKYSRRTA